MNKHTTICFIGAGNMATSLIAGLINSGFNPQYLWASNPSAEKLAVLNTQFGIYTTQDNIHAAKHADIIVLTVKPNILKIVATQLAPIILEKKLLVISTAAGITEKLLGDWLGKPTAVVRCMPNTPALVGSGATALHANLQVTAAHKEAAESIFRSVGLALWVDDEAQMDIVTALSGSGPAYFFLIMEALQEAAVTLGLSKEAARLLTLQTAQGAARMALESNDDVVELRKKVTSPGGTTEYALQVLEQGSIRELILKTLQAAKNRSVELAKSMAE